MPRAVLQGLSFQKESHLFSTTALTFTAPYQPPPPRLAMPRHGMLASLFAVVIAAARPALAGHICSYCNSNGRLSCAYPDSYVCHVALYNTTIRPCSQFTTFRSPEGPAVVSSPGPGGASYPCPYGIADKGNGFSGPDTPSGAPGKPKVYTCESIQGVKAACTCLGKCGTPSTSTSTSATCPSRAPVPVKAFGSVCARPECARECDSTLEKMRSALRALNSATEKLVNHVIQRATKPKTRRRHALQEEATIRGRNDASSPVKVGEIGSPGGGADAGFNTQMTADDASTLTDDVREVAADAGTVIELFELENTDPLRNVIENKVPELKPTRSTFFGKFIPAVIGKVISPLAGKFAEVANDARSSVGNLGRQVEALGKILTIEVCIMQCNTEALAHLKYINCEKRCS